jgi:hypothetical protein
MLGIRVDSLGLTTPEEKLKAIANLKFPYTLQQIETYLGFTGWMRQYVPRYAQTSEPLQERKHVMSRAGPNAGRARKQFARIARNSSPSPAEYEAYRNIQNAFKNPSILIHADKTRYLFIDLDAAKGDTGFGAIVYHVIGELDYLEGNTKMMPPTRPRIQPIMFLSRLLNRHEKNYWPTELEVACLVWVLRKIRHLVEASEKPAIVWTDHAATVGIAKQTSMSTTSTDKLNLRLIQAAQYIQQFRLELYHKPGRTNIVPDALSRLPSDADPAPDTAVLDALHGFTNDQTASYAFTTSLVEVSPELKAALQNGYESDYKLRSLRKDLAKSNTKLPYEDVNGLLYSISQDGTRRLCIPRPVLPQILKLAHDDCGHHGYHRTIAKLQALSIPRLSRVVRSYIDGCPECATYRTPRHKPYGSPQPILTPDIPFHNITLDFILGLPISAEGYDAVMTVTCKFSKRTTFIPGKTTYTAEEWALRLLDALLVGDWGIPVVIISDRDRKFLSAMWKAIFQALSVQLLFATAYHAQTDGSSERTNQTAEIALRYYIHGLPKPQLWPTALPRLQAQLNSSPSSTTGKSPHEICFGIKINAPVDLISKTLQEHGDTQDFTTRVEAAEAIKMAQIAMKRYYDRKHQAKDFEVGQEVMLRLHRGYSIPQVDVVGRKLGPQFAGPFKVIEKIGPLAYRLDLPPHWKIHPVISIAHLEPRKPDPFDRPKPTHEGPVFVEGDTQDQQSYEIERLLARRQRKVRGKMVTEYLVRWLGWGPEYDAWYPTSKLDNARDLIRDYELLHNQKPEA